jgi:hypothetical protein
MHASCSNLQGRVCVRIQLLNLASQLFKLHHGMKQSRPTSGGCRDTSLVSVSRCRLSRHSRALWRA